MFSFEVPRSFLGSMSSVGGIMLWRRGKCTLCLHIRSFDHYKSEPALRERIPSLRMAKVTSKICLDLVDSFHSDESNKRAYMMPVYRKHISFFCLVL